MTVRMGLRARPTGHKRLRGGVYGAKQLDSTYSAALLKDLVLDADLFHP